jgi:hypothetical protein
MVTGQGCGTIGEIICGGCFQFQFVVAPFFTWPTFGSLCVSLCGVITHMVRFFHTHTYTHAQAVYRTNRIRPRTHARQSHHAQVLISVLFLVCFSYFARFLPF